MAGPRPFTYQPQLVFTKFHDGPAPPSKENGTGHRTYFKNGRWIRRIHPNHQFTCKQCGGMEKFFLGIPQHDDEELCLSCMGIDSNGIIGYFQKESQAYWKCYEKYQNGSAEEIVNKFLRDAGVLP